MHCWCAEPVTYSSGCPLLKSVHPEMRVSTAYTVSFSRMKASEWHGYLHLFDDASVYQSLAYGEACWKPRQLHHLVVRHGEEVVAIAQIRVIFIPAIRAGIAYVRWGPLFRRKARPMTIEAFRAALCGLHEEYAQRRGYVVRVIPNVYRDDPWEAEVREALGELDFAADANVRAYRTIRVSLDCSLDDLRKGLHQRWRNKLKNAEKAGYAVREENTESGFAGFVSAYDEMMRRKSFPTTVDVRQMAEMQRRLPAGERMWVFLCHKEETLCNALVVAAAGDTGIYLLAATTDAGLEGNGAFLLQWRAIQRLQEAGLRWYDMGGINPEANPGVYQFKSGVGGVDTAQLGQFNGEGGWLSKLVVHTGERLRGLRARSASSPAQAGDGRGATRHSPQPTSS